MNYAGQDRHAEGGALNRHQAVIKVNGYPTKYQSDCSNIFVFVDTTKTSFVDHFMIAKLPIKRATTEIPMRWYSEEVTSVLETK